MAGIYIHIPFCKQACNYCNFHFSTSLTYKNDFIRSLLKEIPLQKEYFDGERVETIYFGGGTPSLLIRPELEQILEELYRVFPVSSDLEITLEANPDDIGPVPLEEWKDAGINRLSIGIQSFFEEDLRWMNRAHDSLQARHSIELALDKGFSDISIDLIYGTPTLSDVHWEKNIEQALAMNLPHLSCYALTVEPKTPLRKLIAEKKLANVDPDDQARQFLLLLDWMEHAGYEHYEISNFAKPGMRSRHNTSYWQGKKYLGLGPSAHSYNGMSRQWNIANNYRYIQSLQKDQLLFEKELLSPVQVLNEYIMTSLRTREGIQLDFLNRKFGARVLEALLVQSGQFVKAEQMKEEGGALILTRKGKLLADGIASDLFFEAGDQAIILPDDSFAGGLASAD